MSRSREFAILAGLLDRTRSPSERLRVLARAWKQVHRLSAEDRYKLALRVGIEGLDEAIGELAQREGVETPERLRDALAKLATTEPAQARALLAAWRDPQRRAGLLRHGLEAAIDALAGQHTAAGTGPPAAPRPRTGTTQPIPVTAVQAAVAGAPAATVLPPPPSPADRVPDERAAAPRASGRPTTPNAGRGVPAQPAAVTLPLPPITPPLEARSARAAAPAPVAAEATATAVPRATGSGTRLGASPAAKPAHEAALAGARQELALPSPERPAASLLRRFRQLRSELPALVGLDEAALREPLVAFPDGWPRRRALVQLIEGGLPTPHALRLVATLGSRRDRLWCLRTLARQGPLDAAQAAAALGGPLPARLEARLSRHVAATRD